MRLVVEQLVRDLDREERSLNDAIGALVKDGLNPVVQRSLDVTRVTGNDAVHPGEIDVDDEDNVASIMGLVNVIAEQLIEVPRHIEEQYASLPEEKREQIEKRDSDPS